MLTLTDLFCGAGGSSTGAISVPGIDVRVASNHWRLAIDVHQANHPDTDHVCADLSKVDPAGFPTTDILWASPSCTNHSLAKGVARQRQPRLWTDDNPDPSAERSRATMWDVVAFAEHHRYAAIIVENVVDAAAWEPFSAWLHALRSLGYAHQIVSLNSMHAWARGPAAPQSRDRMYVVAWRTGNRMPHLQPTPPASCPVHGPIKAVQSWKRPGTVAGKYRAQYVYRCPRVDCRNQIVEPGWLPASSIIDWNNRGIRIGDRSRPLVPKTRARIATGIIRYWAPITVPVEGRDGKHANPVTGPLRTQTTRLETGVAVPGTPPPLIAELRGGGSTARPVTDPLATVCASGNHHGLVVPYYSNGLASSTTDPLPTVTTVDRHALVTGSARLDPDTIDALVDDATFRMLTPEEVAAAMAFPSDYIWSGTRRDKVRLAGNAVTPPAARDLLWAVTESLSAA